MLHVISFHHGGVRHIHFLLFFVAIYITDTLTLTVNHLMSCKVVGCKIMKESCKVTICKVTGHFNSKKNKASVPVFYKDWTSVPIRKLHLNNNLFFGNILLLHMHDACMQRPIGFKLGKPPICMQSIVR